MEVQQLVDYRAFSLEETEAQKLLANFQFHLDKISEYEILLNKINVEDENDLPSMEEARRLRLALVKIRTGTEGIHERLKADSLRKGKFIDGIKNQILYLVAPLEEKARDKEETQKRYLDGLAQEVYDKRSKELGDLGYPYQHLDIKNMPEEVYQNVVHEAKEMFDLRERLKKEKEQEQIDLANKLAEERKQKELIRTRLSDLNASGLLLLPPYAESDLAKWSDEEFAKVKTDLKNHKEQEARRKQELQIEEQKKQDQLKKEKEIQEIENKKLQEQLRKQKEEHDKQQEASKKKENELQDKLKEQQKQEAPLPKKKDERLKVMASRIRNCIILPPNPTIDEKEFHTDIILICEKYENK